MRDSIPEQLTRQFIEDAWNRGRWDSAREHLSPDFVNHTPVGTESRDDFLSRIKAMRDAFPDWRMRVDEMISAGDRVITRWTATGTHRGAFRGVSPTGREVVVTGIAIDRVVDGKRVEGWAQLDNLGLMRQIGATAT